MNKTKVQEKILFDDDFVLQEVDRLQELYKLKEEIRYAGNRNEELRTESVAEHVFAMYLLAFYFLRLEDPEHNWNHEKIFNMILWHDMDEIITGDKIGYLKTEEDRENEKVAMAELIKQLPDLLKTDVERYTTEYEGKESIESKFAKAIDKIEPSFHTFNENGKQMLQKNGTTLEQHRSIKDPYMVDFPYLSRFNEVLTAEKVRQGFFVE